MGDHRELIAALRDLLGQPVKEHYPLPPGETAASWKAASLAALDGIEALLDLPDALGKPLAGHLRALFDPGIAPPFIQRPGLVRLAGELIRNLADPGRINQGLNSTCSVTSVESFLAAGQPGEYARLLVGLMSTEGTVAMADGTPWPRDEEVMLWSDKEARRSPVSRLFQVSAMEIAYPNLDYRNTFDGMLERGDRTGEFILVGTGVDLDHFDTFLERITGQRWDTLSDKNAHMAKLFEKLGLPPAHLPDIDHDGMDIVRRSVAADEATFVTLDTSIDPEREGADTARFTMPHKVRVLTIDEDAQRVLYEDPLDPEEAWIYGVETKIESSDGRCSMSVEDFDQLMVELSYLPRFWVAPEDPF